MLMEGDGTHMILGVGINVTRATEVSRAELRLDALHTPYFSSQVETAGPDHGRQSAALCEFSPVLGDQVSP